MTRPELVEGRLDGGCDIVSPHDDRLHRLPPFDLRQDLRPTSCRRLGRNRWLQLDGAASDENIFTDEDANAVAGDAVVIHLCRSSRTQITKWARPGRARGPRGASGAIKRAMLGLLGASSGAHVRSGQHDLAHSHCRWGDLQALVSSAEFQCLLQAQQPRRYQPLKFFTCRGTHIARASSLAWD